MEQKQEQDKLLCEMTSEEWEEFRIEYKKYWEEHKKEIQQYMLDLFRG